MLSFFFFKSNQARLSSVPQKAELQIKLNPVFCELDISIVDRLNSLLQPQKLTTVEMMASHMYTSYNKHISLVSIQSLQILIRIIANRLVWIVSELTQTL